MNKLNVVKFGGDDFTVWRFEMESFLAVNDLLDHVTGAKTRPGANHNGQQDAWDKNDQKARCYIVAGLERNIVRQIMSLTTSRDMWKRLSQVYELKDESTVHVLKTQFYEYRMTEGMSIGEHIAKVEELAHKLADVKAKPSDDDILTKILHTLPASYRHLIAAFDSMDPSKRKLGNVIPRLLKDEMLSKTMGAMSLNDSEPIALVHKTSGGYEKKSKYQKRQFPKKDKPNVKFGGKCHFCDKVGHKKAECFRYKATLKDGESGASAMTTSAQLLLSTGGGGSNFSDIWYADTGATHHMTPRRDIFKSFIPIDDKSVPITVGNEDVVYARGRGMIDVVFDVDGRKITQTLDGALFVPELCKN